MKNLSKKLLGTVQVVILALFISVLGIGSYVYGVNGPDYTEPGVPPTGNQPSPPINTSATGQTKKGNLVISGLDSSNNAYTNGLIVTNGRVGIGTLTPTEKLTVNGKFAFTQTGVNDANSGKIDFRGFDPAALSIVGAGSSPNRVVRIFDRLWVEQICTETGANCAPPGTSGGGGHVIKDEGTARPQRINLNFVGAGVTATDNAAGNETTVTIPGGTAGTVSGSGTLYRVPMWFPNGNTLANSPIYTSSGGKVGINTPSPLSVLDVTGDAKISSTLTVGGVVNIGPSGNYIIGATAPDLTIATAGVVNIKKLNLSNWADLYAQSFFYGSDRNLKTNISPLQDSLSKITQLQGVSFNWKQDGKAGIGLIAQDVEKVYPELVGTDPQTGLKSVQYGNLVSPLIEAVKAQQKEIDDLKAQVKDLQSKK